MKRKSMAAEYDDDDDDVQLAADGAGGGGGDVCKSLMDRYAKSSAPQHRHLCASAAAIRLMLQDEGLPLAPPTYFAAVITSIRGADDPDALAALSAFLSILVPLVPADSLPPAKAKDAVIVLASVLKERGGGSTTGAVRSVVKSLGALTLRVDLQDWEAIELPLETLLAFSLDKRPKVRRCAQMGIEKIFEALRNSVVVKKAGNIVFSLYKNYIPSLSNGPAVAKKPKSDHFEAIQVLVFLKLIVRNLSKKNRMHILSDLGKLLSGCSPLLVRHILGVIEAIIVHTTVKVLGTELENIISALASYISSSKNGCDETTISVLLLLKISMTNLRDAQPGRWVQNLPGIFKSAKGFLISDDNTSEDFANILKEIIDVDLDWRMLLTTTSLSCNTTTNTPESNAIISLCSVFKDILGESNIPTKNLLVVISILFLKLGDLTCTFMKDILLELSRWIIRIDNDLPAVKLLQECIGSAIISMGPEKVLSLIPISLNEDELTCSNAWLLPILRKYVVGSSLCFFLEHIVPLSKSIYIAASKVKKKIARSHLQSYARGLWELLPSFCRHPSDTCESFGSLAKLLIVALDEDPSLHQTIALSLQELVIGNRHIIGDHEVKNDLELSTSPSIEYPHVDWKSSMALYSKKAAFKNIEALASNSIDLIQKLTDIFFVSPPEKRAYLKDAIGSLASIVKSEDIYIFFLTLLKKLDIPSTMHASSELEGLTQEVVEEEEKERISVTEKNHDQRILVVELADAFVKVGNKDLINTLFDLIRPSLLAANSSSKCGELCTLSKLLKEHSWFCVDRTDDLMDLLRALKESVDPMVVNDLLSCYEFLLIHLIKKNEEEENDKAFLILNEIILALKSKKESRKLAYDVLLAVNCGLKNSETTDGVSDRKKLIIMVMGYLSSSSPHIISGAISALSLLTYNDPEYAIAVPNLVPSILLLLRKETTEITKAALGFVKVLVSSLNSSSIMKLVTDILTAILPLSSVSKWHFRSKVSLILEILIRKCGFDSIDMNVPKAHKEFVKAVAEGREYKRISSDVAGSEMQVNSAETPMKGSRKRMRDQVSDPEFSDENHQFSKSRAKERKNRDILSQTILPANKDGLKEILMEENPSDRKERAKQHRGNKYNMKGISQASNKQNLKGTSSGGHKPRSTFQARRNSFKKSSSGKPKFLKKGRRKLKAND